MTAKSPVTAFPPVFVMNPYYTGIGIARNLRHKGPKVYGLSSEKNAPGSKSRFYDHVYDVPNGRDKGEALCQRLIEIRQDHTVDPVIFPTRDFDVLFLHHYRERLAPFYRISQAEGDSVLILLDKLELTKMASRCSIAAPKTLICTSLGDLEKQVRILKFPIIVKPRFAYQWRREGAWKKVGGQKAILLESVDRLRDEYLKLAPVTTEVLLQEYIPGVDTDVVVCCCYLSKDGRLLGYYTARKLRQNPPLLGTACVVELADIPEIVPPAVQLLRACAYSGLAEIEFKYDKIVNTFFLIEINPRHWDQHELGNRAGVNLTWISYEDIVGRNLTPRKPNYNHQFSYRWIAEREAVLLFIHGTSNQFTHRQQSGRTGATGVVADYFWIVKGILSDLIDLLRGRKIFAVVHPYDPAPGILMCLRVFGEIIKAVASRAWSWFTATKVHRPIQN